MQIASFENPQDLQRVTFNNTRGELAPEHATDGKQSLKVCFEKATWPGLSFAAKTAYDRSDWREFGSLLLDVHNPEQAPIRLHVRVDDDDAADGRAHCISGSAEVPPGATKTLVFALRHQQFGMRGEPSLAKEGLRMSRDEREIDLSHVTKFLVFLGRPASEHTLYLDNVRLGPPPRMEGIVDRFGQYAFGEWPGKLHEESELATRRSEEAEYLKTAPQPTNRDEYGGWAAGPQLEATGFFRTEKVGEKWWLVTPTGRLFWSAGMDCVRPDEGRTPVAGREYMFTWLPKPGEPAHRFLYGKPLYFSFYSANLLRKYGDDYLQPWLDITFQRLRTWGFNTIGNWSSDDVFRQKKVPYTVPLHYGGVPKFENGWREIVDVFDPAFPKAVEAGIEKGTAQWRDDPWCLGYFVDNELSWGSWNQEQQEYDLPRNVLAATDALAAKREFVSWLKGKYGEVERLNQAWGVRVESWEQMTKAPLKPLPKINNAMAADFRELVGHFAERYFTVVRDAMKRHAPKQLYLGCRIAARAPEPVARLQAKYADVVSYNWYCAPEKFVEHTRQAADLGRPVIIGEFHFGALDRGMFHTGLGPVASQEERGRAYAGYVTEALKQPWCVGAHWFIYADQALTGRFDGENYNIGFVNCTDTPYPELCAAARGVNFRIYEIRGSAGLKPKE